MLIWMLNTGRCAFLRYIVTHQVAMLQRPYQITAFYTIYIKSPQSNKATSRQLVDGFLRRSIRSGYCLQDTPTFAEQCATVDEQLFNSICHNENHVLYSLLPPPSTASQNYHLPPRAHSQQLPQHTGHLTDSNFITRMLFTDIH